MATDTDGREISVDVIGLVRQTDPDRSCLKSVPDQLAPVCRLAASAQEGAAGFAGRT